MNRVAAQRESEPQQRRDFVMARRKSYQRGNVQFHNGVWTLRYREFDYATRTWITRRERLGTFKTKKEARRAAEPIMARVNKRNNSDKPSKVQSDMTFKQFVAGRWRAYTVSAKHQPSTVDCYNNLLNNHLLPVFGARRLNQIVPTDISDFLDAKRPIVAANTLMSFYGLLRLLFDLAVEYDLIERSPVRPKLHRPETAKVEKPTLDAQSIRAILAATPDRQERLFTLLIAVTGLRLGETLALRWMDFDQERLELAINHTLYRNRLKPPKTESSRRAIRLVPAIAGLLVSHHEQSAFQADTDFIFCRADGSPFNPVVLRVKLHRAMEAAGIRWEPQKFGFHIFRHSAGTLLYAKSRDLKLVQGALGHADISTTSDIYVHLDDKVISEGTGILAEEILANCDLFVTQKRKRVG